MKEGTSEVSSSDGAQLGGEVLIIKISFKDTGMWAASCSTEQTDAKVYV